jgi:hypothetical protein
MRWAGCAARALHTYQLKLMVIRERSEMILYSILPRRYGTSHASHVGDRGVVVGDRGVCIGGRADFAIGSDRHALCVCFRLMLAKKKQAYM